MLPAVYSNAFISIQFFLVKMTINFDKNSIYKNALKIYTVHFRMNTTFCRIFVIFELNWSMQEFLKIQMTKKLLHYAK